MKNRMLELKEMVDIITRYKLKELKVLGYTPDDEGYYEQFYNMIADRIVETDEEAAKKLMNSTPKDRDYRRVKNEFQKRLVNSIFFIDLKEPDFNDSQKAYYNGWKYLAAVKILMGRGARRSGIFLAKKAIDYAIKYEYTEITLALGRLLKNHYCMAEGDEKLWLKYRDIVNKNLETIRLEVLANDYYEELILPFIKSRTPKPEIQVKAQQYLKELEPYFNKVNSFNFHYLYYGIKRIEVFSVYDYQAIAKVSREAIQFFENYKNLHKGAIAGASHSLVIALTILGEYEEAEQHALRAEPLLHEGTPNWYKGRLQHLSLKFYTQKFNEAYEIFRKATKHKSFEKLPQMDRELWKIQEGYINLLIQAGAIDASFLRPKPKPFKLHKFLNEFGEATKDKRGLNVPLQILHTLFLLLEKDYDKAEDRIHALAKYANRHVGVEDEGFRTTMFIRMLQKMSTANFKLPDFDVETDELLEEMGHAPVMLMNQAHEVEYIRYEYLWNLAVQAVTSRRALVVSV